MEDETAIPDMTCPFCGECGFDDVGLKMHLLVGWCEPFDEIPQPRSAEDTKESRGERARKRAEQIARHGQR